MWLLEESDLEKYMRKLHINREAQGQKLDLTNLTEEEIEELLKNYSKKRAKPYQIPKKDYNLLEFKRIVKDFKDKQSEIEAMEPLERDKCL